MRSILSKTHKRDMTMLYEFVLLVAIIVIVSLLVFQVNEDARETILSDNVLSATVANESGYINATGYTLAGASVFNSVNFVITSALNATDNTTILSGNYSVSSAGIVTNASTTTYGTALISYTYNYNEKTTAYNATTDSDTAVAKIPKSLKLLATAIIFGAVLFVILRVIPLTNKRTSTFQ